MSELKATPGPWEWYTSNSYARLGTADGYQEIMYAVKYRDGVCGIELRNPADAHLIAAAPRGYALAETVESMVVDGGLAEDDAWSLVLQECRAFMAQARGETE